MIRGSGEPDQITKQYGDGLTLVGRPVGRLFDQRAARQAKSRDLWVHPPHTHYTPPPQQPKPGREHEQRPESRVASSDTWHTYPLIAGNR